jgi:hypothetical protein
MTTTELHRLLSKATPGPWVIECTPFTANIESRKQCIVGGNGMASYGQDVKNAALIAAAVNALPALLDVLDAAQDVLDMAEHNRETLTVIASLSGAYERVDAMSLLALAQAMDKVRL